MIKSNISKTLIVLTVFVVTCLTFSGCSIGIVPTSPSAVIPPESSPPATSASGQVWVWGDSQYGYSQLMPGFTNNTTSTILNPIQLGGLSGIKAVSAGLDHVLHLNQMERFGRGATTSMANWAIRTWLSAVRRFR